MRSPRSGGTARWSSSAHNVPLPRIAEYLASIARALVIEFVPKADSQVQRMLAAREDISAFRKDVTTGLYGGDVSRKKKVLAKQAKGKKRLKRFGKVDIPAEAFTVMLKRD